MEVKYEKLIEDLKKKHTKELANKNQQI